MRRLTEDGDDRNTLAERARRRIAEQFGAEQMVAQTRAVYDEVLAPSRQARRSRGSSGSDPPVDCVRGGRGARPRAGPPCSALASRRSHRAAASPRRRRARTPREPSHEYRRVPPASPASRDGARGRGCIETHRTRHVGSDGHGREAIDVLDGDAPSPSRELVACRAAGTSTADRTDARGSPPRRAADRTTGERWRRAPFP